MTALRAETLMSKEPGTIAWIDGFSKGSLFWDIGANIGAYTLYAAVIRACRVYAFEPGSANYYGLNNNILRNRLSETVTALPVAFDSRCRVDKLRMRNNEIGGALHVFGQDTDFSGERFEATWQQGAIGFSIDRFRQLFGLAVPAHIKIDVDGLETAIVEGGAETFADFTLKSVLIEVDLNDVAEVRTISELLLKAGLDRDNASPGNIVREFRGLPNLQHDLQAPLTLVNGWRVACQCSVEPEC